MSSHDEQAQVLLTEALAGLSSAVTDFLRREFNDRWQQLQVAYLLFFFLGFTPEEALRLMIDMGLKWNRSEDYRVEEKMVQGVFVEAAPLRDLLDQLQRYITLLAGGRGDLPDPELVSILRASWPHLILGETAARERYRASIWWEDDSKEGKK